MRQASTLIALILASSALVSGCSSLSPQETALAGVTYELTEPACHAEFSDGASILFPGKCITLVRTDSFKKVELPAGTCLKLGEPQVFYPEFSRAVVYEVEVAGVMSTISGLDSPRRPWKGMVKGGCTPAPAFLGR